MPKFDATQIALSPEKAADYPAIGNLLDSAFTGHDETLLVERIRSTLEYLNGLTLVARTSNSELLGYIMMSHVYLRSLDDSCMDKSIVAPDDTEGVAKVLALGPLAVHPSRQKQGVGAALVKGVIRLAETRSEQFIVLLGHADYYPRFGFERASLYGIRPPLDWEDESFMIYRLPGWSGAGGKISYPPAWQI